MLTIQRIKNLLRTSIKLQETNSTVLVPLIVGTYGIGKTQISKQVAEQEGLEPVFIILSSYDPSLWLVPVRNPETGLIEMKPIATLLRNKIVIIFDEIDKARNYQLAPVLSIVVGKRLGDEKIHAPVICIANSDTFVYSFPALRSRLMLIHFPIPVPDEVISYLTDKYSHYFSQVSPFTQKVITTVFEYSRKFGVHDGTECPLWTPRTIESLIAYLIELNSTSMSPEIVQVLLSHFGETRYNEFVSLLDESNFPDPHTSDKNEIVQFLQKPISSAHYSFVRLYTIHLITCENPHPLSAAQFITLLSSSLIDIFVSTLKSVNHPRTSEIIAELTTNEETNRLISVYVSVSSVR